MSETARPYAPSALPSVAARLLAFVAILVGGLCGGLIGWSVTDLQCGSGNPKIVIGATTSTTAPVTTTTTTPKADESGCSSWNAGGALVGALVGAGGTAIVSVLVLRAMAEWRRDLDVDEAPDSPS
ncbi:MAG: hypothetical protein JWO68_2431 [Actinomycetia bacterium]|nr:hypothetical protein [Actinomycetes bacterium]